jgi:hypothetical protein
MGVWKARAVLFLVTCAFALDCGGPRARPPDDALKQQDAGARPVAAATAAGSVVDAAGGADAGTVVTREPPPVRRKCDPGPDDELDLCGSGRLRPGFDDGPRSPPDEVVADRERTARIFTDVDAADALKLEVKSELLLQAIPPRNREVARAGMLELADDATGTIALAGRYIDTQRSLFVARYQYGAVEAVLLLLDARGRFLQKLVLEQRNSVSVGDVAGDGTAEVLINVIHGTAVSVWPASWRLYEIAGGRLARIAEVAKSYSEGARHESYHFFNRVEFPSKGEMIVRTVIYSGSRSGLAGPPPRSPTRLGEQHRYRYDPARHSFVEIAGTPRPAGADKKQGSVFKKQGTIDGF